MTTEHIDSWRELTAEEKLFLRGLEIQRLRDALEAMTARKDGWRRVARALREDRNEVIEYEVGQSHVRPHAKILSIMRRHERAYLVKAKP